MVEKVDQFIMHLHTTYAPFGAGLFFDLIAEWKSNNICDPVSSHSSSQEIIVLIISQWRLFVYMRSDNVLVSLYANSLSLCSRKHCAIREKLKRAHNDLL